jgi:PqqD family protein of HPr-rel-A system
LLKSLVAMSDRGVLDVSRLRDLAISDTGFIFDPLTGHTYSANQTALAVVRALKAGESADAIVQQLADLFDTEPEDDLARDVDEFLVRLREDGLVR